MSTPSVHNNPGLSSQPIRQTPSQASDQMLAQSLSLTLTVNGIPLYWSGDPSTPLLAVLRNELHLTTVKDGCSGQSTCGACLVEIDGKAALACSTLMGKLDGASVLTLDGFPENLRRTLAAAFVNRGAVQCGFCTPGFLTRAKILLQTNASPTREEVVKAVRPHLCRCTGYQPLVDAILDAASALRDEMKIELDQRPGAGTSRPKYRGMERALGQQPFVDDLTDKDYPGMLHGALVFSEHPRARILSLDLAEAQSMSGVVRVLAAPDVPGRQTTGMFIKDWPIFVDVGDVTRYIGDVLACVVAETDAQARAAARAVKVGYEVLPGLFDAQEALDQDKAEHPIFVEPAAGTNLLLDKTIRRGPMAGADFDVDDLLARCAHSVEAVFTTPAVEHAFLETEACLAVPLTRDGKTMPATEDHTTSDNAIADTVTRDIVTGDAAKPFPSTNRPLNSELFEPFEAYRFPSLSSLPSSVPRDGPLLRVFDQAQGIWHNREDIAAALGLPGDKVAVELMDAGGGFGGKEDITVQVHAALAAWLIQRPVKVRLSRPESLRMHPKRHAMRLVCSLGCDERGKLLVAKIRVLADAGAYASVSSAVVTRTGAHATGVYDIPHVDVRVQAVYTNNIPAGAFRGFGVNQSNFALESTVDLLCAKADFDPWQFRYDNAVRPGGMITTGQILGPAVGIRETLLAVKDACHAHPRAGLACAIKNAGIGNGVPEPCDCFITVTPGGGLRLDHGWTEMGQGLHTVALQIVSEALPLDPSVPVSVLSSTESGAFAGSTTASRGTFQLGLALLDAAAALRRALEAVSPDLFLPYPSLSSSIASPLPSSSAPLLTSSALLPLAGQRFHGHYDSAGQTSEDGPPGKVRNHVSYSFATHVAFLDENGRVERVLAAHDSGRVINRALYESQITGGVAMGLGYALSEALPQANGLLVSDRLAACGLLRSTDMPRIDVIPIEIPDPEGPLGAKGLGELSSIPTTAAVVNALARFSGSRCYDLPVGRERTKEAPPPPYPLRQGHYAPAPLSGRSGFEQGSGSGLSKNFEHKA